MKRLLQISVTAGADSTGAVAMNIARGVRSRGGECVTAFGRGAAADEHCLKIGNSFSLALHGAATRLFDAQGCASVAATKRLLRFIADYKPDIIQIHNIHGYYLNYSVLFGGLRKTGIPVVWTLHDCWPLTGHCAFFETADCSRYIDGCGRCPLRNQYPRSLIDASRRNWALKRSAFAGMPDLTLVAVSHWLEKVAQKSILAQYPCEVIHNGVDTDLFACGAGADRPSVIAAAGCWEPRKGLEHVLKLREHLPSDWRMTIVGLSPAQMRRLPAGIIGLGRVSAAEMAKLLGSSTVFVNTSTGDNYPTTIIESLSTGTPVVTYATGGCAEALTPETGIAVPRGNVEALAGAVQRAASMNRDACRVFSKKNCTTYIAVNKYIELYGKICP